MNEECRHVMRSRGWRKGTECEKCDFFLPHGLTWLSAEDTTPETFTDQVTGETISRDTAFARAGARTEHDRLMKLLLDLKVIRYAEYRHLVFVNCDTLEVEYLPDTVFQGVDE